MGKNRFTVVFIENDLQVMIITIALLTQKKRHNPLNTMVLELLLSLLTYSFSLLPTLKNFVVLYLDTFLLNIVSYHPQQVIDKVENTSISVIFIK